MMAKTATDVNGNVLTFSYQMFGNAIPKWTIPSLYTGPYYQATPTNATSAESPSLQLSQVSSSDGRSVSFTYDATYGRLVSMTDNTGRTWSYTYLTPDANNSRTLSKVTLPTGLFWSYGYGSGAFLTAWPPSKINPLNSATVANRRVTSLTYPNGGTVTYEYGYFARSGNLDQTPLYTNGEQVVRRTLSTGPSWSYVYTPGNSGQYDTTIETGPDGVTTYKFMGVNYAKAATSTIPPYQNNAWRVGQLMERTLPSGSTETYIWTPRVIANIYTLIRDTGAVHDEKVWAADLAQKTITRDGATYTTAYSNYDVYGNPGTIVESGPNGGARTTTLTYFNDSNKWIIGKLKDETYSGSSTTRTFDANGNVLTINRDGVQTSFTYDSQGNVSTKTLPRNQVYTYTNYKLGTPQSESQPEGISISRTINNAGNISSETNGDGYTTSYVYDGLNRVTGVYYPLGNPKTITYTANSKSATRGSLTELTNYDGFGRPTSITLGGITTTYQYDALDRKTFESNPGSTAGTSYQYDALNRITKITNADGSYRSIAYGAGTKTLTDERGNATLYTYRSYGNPDQQWLMSITAADTSANLSLTRNSNDLVTAATQAGFTRTYGYNSNFYLTSVTNPETGTTTYGRDAAGNMTSRSVGTSGITTFTYDGQNRLTATTYPGATPAVTNTYNKTNKLLSVNSSAANRSYSYDANGNLTNESSTVDGITFTTGYIYNNLDQLSTIIYPVSGSVIDYAPDVLGRPTQVSGYVTGVNYWPSGQIQEIDYANGTVTNYGQNSRLWPSSFSTRKAGTYYLNSNYSYDGLGNLTNISDTADGSYIRTLNYDELNRLSSITGPWGAGFIMYDGAGNIVSQLFGRYRLTYTYDNSNRLSSIVGNRATSYSYDAYGNVTSDSNNAYLYDDSPNLLCVNCSGTTNKIQYTYDGTNHRTAVIKNGVKNYEVYNSRGNLLIEYTPSQSNKLTEYIYLGGKRVAQRVTP
jgi:YD repeat-containing protein